MNCPNGSFFCFNIRLQEYEGIGTKVRKPLLQRGNRASLGIAPIAENVPEANGLRHPNIMLPQAEIGRGSAPVTIRNHI